MTLNAKTLVCHINRFEGEKHAFITLIKAPHITLVLIEKISETLSHMLTVYKGFETKCLKSHE